MAILAELTSGELTKLRSGKWRGQQFVALCPNTDVVQFQPSAAPTDNIYAEISVGSVASGSMSNIASFQRVIFSTSSDYKATEFYRTYVRKVSGTSVLYIGQCSQTLTTSDYVTVQDAYDIVERPRIVRGGVEYSDWEITFRRVLPTEAALPSAVVLTRDTTAYSPTASPVAMDNDATSTFTHAWSSSNSNDTLDSGGTTNNPTFTLEAGAFRHIRYTFTDSNGNAGLRVIAVWTVPTDYSASANLGFIGDGGNVASITRSQESASCDIPAFSGISDVLEGTFCAVFTDEWYNDTFGSIRTNIDYVGYLAQESTSTGGSVDYGYVSTGQFSVESIQAIIARTPVTQYGDINATASPSAWGDMENPTPARVVHFTLTEHTTLPIVCAIQYPDSDTDFVTDGEVLYNDEREALTAITSILDIYKSIVQVDVDGRIDVARALRFRGSTARNAADVVATISPSDMMDYTFTKDPVQSVGLATVVGGMYDTAISNYVTRQATAPVTADIRGIQQVNVVNQLFETDSSIATFESDIASRCANIYAAQQPAPTVNVTFWDGWHFLTNDVDTWFKFDIALTDTIRGIVYDTNTRWELIEVTTGGNNREGAAPTTGTFRLETQSTSAIVDVTTPRNADGMNTDEVPATFAPWLGGDLGLTDGIYDDGQSAQPPDEETPPPANCELLAMRPKVAPVADSVDTPGNGDTIVTLVRGSGKIGSGTRWCYEFDFTAGDGSWAAVATNQGTHSGGTGWVHGDYTAPGSGSEYRIVNITRSFTASTITKIIVTYDLTKGSYSTPVSAINITDGTTQIQVASSSDASSGSGQTITWEGTQVMDTITAFVRSSYRAPANGSFSGSATITNVEIHGIGSNPFGADNCTPDGTDAIYGDAYYYWSSEIEPTAYDPGYGFLIEGDQPTGIPPYNAEHTYETSETSNGSQVNYTYGRLFDASEMENFSFQIRLCVLD